MARKTFIVEELGRSPEVEGDASLRFTSGLNVFVGRPNTGKTTWIKMLNFLLGDPDPVEQALGNQLADKYDRVWARLRIADEVLAVERRWKEAGSKTKVFVGDDGMSTSEFCNYLLAKLDIPQIHFPKGNPYTETSWPQLSFRMLLRHMYRQDRFWSDLADRQPEVEQHACLMQFLGLASNVFPQQLGQVVDRRKQLLILEARKEQFQSIFSELTKDLVSVAELRVSPTIESADSAISALQEKSSDLTKRRDDLLTSAKSSVEQAEMPSLEAQAAERRATVVEERASLLLTKNKTERRLSELRDYQASVENEISRIRRSLDAGEVLVDLKATNCPVCDQEVTQTKTDDGTCYLCHRSVPKSNATSGTLQRIEFELEQLEEEQKEIGELVQRFKDEVADVQDQLFRLAQELDRLEHALRPLRSAIASVLPPDLGIIDAEIGRIQEQIQQLERVKRAIHGRDTLSKRMDELQGEVEQLSGKLDDLSEVVDFEQSGDLLADGINSYLNALNAEDPKRWEEGPVSVQLRDRSFKISIGGTKWSSKLGATLTCYFLLAYHYSLVRLSNESGLNYPGFCIVDFPPTLADGIEVADKENYLVEPFRKLVALTELSSTQVIVSGRAFDGLSDVNRVELNHVWT